MRPNLTWLVPALLLCACPANPTDKPDASATDSDAGEIARSAKGTLRFKGPERLTFDIARALDIPPDQVCLELGQYQCSSFVHQMSLGGVDPYGVGQYEPLTVTGTASPLVIDRMVLSACTKRVALDLSTPATAVVFKGLPLDGAGKLTNVTANPVRDVIVSLFQRGVLRDPTEQEVQSLQQLATDIAATNTAKSGEAWMKAACFTVLSSAESVFY